MNQYLQLGAILGTDVSAQIPSLRSTQNKFQPPRMQTKLPLRAEVAADKPVRPPAGVPSPGGSLPITKRAPDGTFN